MPEERRPQVIAHAIATGTDKPSRVDVTTALELRVALDVAEILYGADWHDRPRLWIVDQHDLAAAALGSRRAGRC